MVQAIEPGVLRTWAELGTALTVADRERSLDWRSVERLVAAAQEVLSVQAERLRLLLQKSQERLKPLGEPLCVDMGVHRWLSADREEAYSDWLAWIIGQVREPSLVLRILGFGMEQDTSGWTSDRLEVRRECPVPFGHDEHTGRLDILIRYPGLAVIVVEVKVVGVDRADCEKQQGYHRWLRREVRGQERPLAVLVATDSDEPVVEEFPFVSWARVCLALRSVARGLRHGQELIVPSMILAFVGAVEQNLLGFSTYLVQQIVDGRTSLFDSRIVDHFEQWLGEEG